MLVRVKDRLNTPVEKSGHRDVLINFEHELTAVRKSKYHHRPGPSFAHWCLFRVRHSRRTGFVGELQLTFRGLLDVKASAHRIYNISRAREDEEDAAAAVSEPSLRNSDVLLAGRARVESIRALALRRIDRAAKGAGRALPRGLVVSAIYDGTGGAAKVRLDLADVAALQRLRDAVLDGSIDENSERKFKRLLSTAARSRNASRRRCSALRSSRRTSDARSSRREERGPFC